MKLINNFMAKYLQEFCLKLRRSKRVGRKKGGKIRSKWIYFYLYKYGDIFQSKAFIGSGYEVRRTGIGREKEEEHSFNLACAGGIGEGDLRGMSSFISKRETE